MHAALRVYRGREVDRATGLARGLELCWGAGVRGCGLGGVRSSRYFGVAGCDFLMLSAARVMRMTAKPPVPAGSVVMGSKDEMMAKVVMPTIAPTIAMMRMRFESMMFGPLYGWAKRGDPAGPLEADRSAARRRLTGVTPSPALTDNVQRSERRMRLDA